MKQLHDGIYWINECYEMDSSEAENTPGRTHQHVSVYLIHDRSSDRYVLVDSGSFYHREAILEGIDAATDGAGIDALILSHSDYPHSGNVGELLGGTNDVELVASAGSPRAQGLPPDATRSTIGETLTVCGREFSFIDPPLADRSHTTWIYDHGSGGLFVADGFGSYHEPGHCSFTSADFEDGIAPEAIDEFHADTLVWLRYVDPTKLRTALESIFETYDPAYVAPIHGHPIDRADLDRYLDRLVEAATRIESSYAVPGRD